MSITHFFGLLVMVLTTAGAANATCAFIKNHDQKEMCKASKGGTCAFIKDRDLREYCKAIYKGQSCAFIKNRDLKEKCRTQRRK